MRAVDGEFLFGHSVAGFVRHGDFLCGDRAVFVAVLVVEAIAFFPHCFEILAHRVHTARGVHPSGALVETLVDEELAPRDSAVGIKPFVAHHLKLGPEIKRSMRIDQQQRVVRRGVRRGDGHAIRSAGLCWLQIVPGTLWAHGNFAVERCELIEVHALDVAADAAFRERKRHPRFKSLDNPRFQLRMLVEIEVQSIRERVHQRLQPCGARCILRLHRGGVNEEFHAQVLVDFGFALGLRQTSHGVDVVCLDAIEIVFGLCVLRTEDRVGVRFSVDVRDAPIIPRDGHIPSFLLPPRDLGTWRRRKRQRRGCGRENEEKSFHESPTKTKGYRQRPGTKQHERKRQRNIFGPAWMTPSHPKKRDTNPLHFSLH